MILNEYFDKIYVLTIERNFGRQNKISTELKNLGINFEFIYGYDGERLSEEFLIKQELYDKVAADKYLFNLNREMSINEIAANLTHRKAYLTAKENNYQRVLFLEDDITLKTYNDSYFKEVISDCRYDEWDLLYLGTTYKDLHEKGRSKYTSLVRFCYGAIGYALTAKGIKKIIDEYPIVNKPADDCLFTMTKENVLYGLTTNLPMVTHDDLGISSIGERPEKIIKNDSVQECLILPIEKNKNIEHLKLIKETKSSINRRDFFKMLKTELFN